MGRPLSLYATEVPEERAAWRRLGKSALLILNIAALLGLGVFGVDWLVQRRIEQFVNAYHQGVIVPLTKPPQAPQGPPASPKEK